MGKQGLDILIISSAGSGVIPWNLLGDYIFHTVEGKHVDC